MSPVENEKLRPKNSLHPRPEGGPVKKLLQVSTLALLGACYTSPEDTGASNEFTNECNAPEVLHQYAVTASTPTVEIPVCVHYVYPDQDSYESGWNPQNYYATPSEEAQGVFENANEGFIGYFDEDSRIQLKLLNGEAPNIIINSEWANAFYEWRDEEKMDATMEDLRRQNNLPGCVNYYILPDDPTAPSNVAAQAVMPSNSPEASGVVTKSNDELVIVHEFGHVLGLYHTDEAEKFGDSVEHPDEGYTTGDLLKDTPPDPGLSYTDSETEEYIPGCYLTNSGWDYETNEAIQELVCSEEFEYLESSVPYTNWMTHYSYEGDHEFTPEQVSRMHCTWDRHEENVYEQE